MREGLRSNSSRKIDKADSGDDAGELEGAKVPDLNFKGAPDVVFGGEEGKCCSEVRKINVKSNGSLWGGGLDEEECKSMEVELEGMKSGCQSVKCSKVDDSDRKEMQRGLDDQMSIVDGNVLDCSVVMVNGVEKFYDCSETLGGTTGMGGQGAETGVEDVNCAVGTVDQVMTLSSVALEHVDKHLSVEELEEMNLQRNNEIDDKASGPQGVEIDTVRSDSGTATEAEEKVDGTEISDCKFDEDGKGERLNVEAEQASVQVVGKVLRSRIVPANGEVSGGGQFTAQLKRKRGTDSPGEVAVTAKEESGKSAFNSGRVHKRGRPKKSVNLSEGEVALIDKVQVDSKAEDEDVKRRLVKTRKKKGKRGRPRKSIDPVEEVLQLNNVPFILEEEDEKLDNKKVQFAAGAADDDVKRKADKTRKKKGKRGRPKKSVDLDNKTVGTPKQKGKRGRPKKFFDSAEGNVVQMNKYNALSKVAAEDLNSKSVRNSKKKGKRGRPRKSLNYPDGDVDCDIDAEAGDLSKRSVKNSESGRRRGRPRKSIVSPEEEVVKAKNVSFHEVDSEAEFAGEELSNKLARTLKKKRRRGRPKKKGGSHALRTTFHYKGKVKNETKMKVSLVAAPVRRSRRYIHPDKMQKPPTNAAPGMKGVVLDRKVSFTWPEVDVVHSSSKGQEKLLTKDNMSKKRKRVEKVGSLSAEKNSIRNQIVNMLLAAGWTVEYRPRLGREYSDAVYVNREGKTHWSVTKAYFTLKQEFEEGNLVSGAAKSNFSFNPIPEEILCKLFRVVSKTRSDKNKRKKFDDEDIGENKHSMKRKPAIRSGSQNKRRCALLVRRSKNSESEGIVAHSGKHSILAWMIDSDTIPINGKVHYMNRRKTRVMLEGSITRDGIHCYCCKEVMSVAEFEKHAGSKLCEPYESLYLESGLSLLQCQLDSWSRQDEAGRYGFHSVPVDGDDPNDDTCGICGDGGELVCCDGCPSTFHHECLDVEEVPSGEWHCFYCSCKYCGAVGEAASEIDDDCEHPSSSLVSCSLCQEKYHPSCVDDEDVCTESKQPSFCGTDCEQIFAGLQSLVGAKRDLGDGFSCTLLKRSDVQEDASTWQPQKILSNSKLAVALSIMDECFLPILDHRSGINLIRHIVYSCGSNFKRLNFSSFFTVVLEKGDEVISAASIRICGKQLAEMPFIGTRNVYRRQGMCRRLLNAIEVALASLNVENLVIPAIPELLQTWTSVFGFKPLEDCIKEEMRSVSMLVFPHTDMLQKPLLNQQLVQKSITTTEEDAKCGESGNIEYMDGGADKSEVDDGCLNGTFDLNSASPILPESSPDKDDVVLPENKLEVQSEEASLLVSPEGSALKPDLNLMVEIVYEDDVDPNSLKSSSEEKGIIDLVSATDQVAKSPTDSPSLTDVDVQSTLGNGHRDTGSPPIKSSREERTHNFDLNLMEENIPEFNKLPSGLVDH